VDRATHVLVVGVILGSRLIYERLLATIALINVAMNGWSHDELFQTRSKAVFSVHNPEGSSSRMQRSRSF
jgi:hypothetical protein